MSDEQRYTLTEAERELVRRACEADGHEPHQFDYTYESHTARSGVCRCGQVAWTPTHRKTTV